MHKNKLKEPDFMRELHKIREKLTKEWKKTTLQDMLASLHKSGRWLKSQLRMPSIK